MRYERKFYGENPYENEIYNAVFYGEIDKLEGYIKNGWNVNEKIPMELWDTRTPVMIGVKFQDYDLIEFLLKHKAKLDMRYHHALLEAISSTDEEMIRYVVSKGAKLEVEDHCGRNAYNYAYKEYSAGGANYFPLLQELGLDIRNNAAGVLRSCICRDDHEIFDYVVSLGVDIDCEEKSSKTTPLRTAIHCGNYEFVKKIVNLGANLELESKYGRPYIEALFLSRFEIAEFLRECENPELHSPDKMLTLAESYCLPEEVIAMMQNKDRKIYRSKFEEEADEDSYFEIIKLEGLFEYKIGRKKYLCISSQVEEYPTLFLLWDAKKSKVVYYDYEQDLFGEFGSWKKFSMNPFRYIDAVLTDEFLK